MNDLQSYTQAFLLNGKFSNNLDNFGNINLNVSASSANQIFIAYDLRDNNYDTGSIVNLYDTSITNNTQQVTTTQVTQDLVNSYNQLVTDNESLKIQLDTASKAADQNPSQAEIQAQKDIIIQLRIQLGQGTQASDFSSEFPYQAL
jgi:hypothetical protein